MTTTPPPWPPFDPGVARPIAQHANDAPDQHTSDGPAEIVIPRQPVPQPVRHTQDPLPNRDIRKHPIDQVRGPRCRPAPAAAWAERTPLARKRHEAVESAVAAPKAREAAGQPPASEEITERLLDEAR